MFLLWLIIILAILLDFITERGFHKTFPQFASVRRKSIRRVLIVQLAVSVAVILCGIIFSNKISDYRILTWYSYIFGCVAALYIPKSVYALFLLLDRLIQIRRHPHRQNRRHIAAKCGFWAGIVTIFIVFWGILFGKYNCTIDRVEISFDHLPVAFDGYKIVQISDVHAGSFAGSFSYFQKATDLINSQQADLIVFTGDLINNFADETIPLIPIFSQLYARDGKYAILGNHDYGGYYNWKSSADSVNNLEALKNAIKQMGFILLNNQSETIIRGHSDSIALIGAENWGYGKKRPKYANLEQAMEKVQDIPFKLLLSHDPWFWKDKVKNKTDITLTLSGHTHGMQIGVKIGKKHYSVGFLNRIRYLSGLYHTNEQYLYVNRGIGVIGFPGRIGISPEITVITLRHGKTGSERSK